MNDSRLTHRTRHNVSTIESHAHCVVAHTANILAAIVSGDESKLQLFSDLLILEAKQLCIAVTEQEQ